MIELVIEQCMAQSKDFLPLFDVAKIENYFFADYSSIAAFFKIISENLDEDFNKIASGFSNNDITALKNALHTIKPIFGISGLPHIQKEVDDFYALCKRCNSMDEVRGPYEKLRPMLQAAKELISAQSQIFQQKSQ
jgi:hypothetical protein